MEAHSKCASALPPPLQRKFPGAATALQAGYIIIICWHQYHQMRLVIKPHNWNEETKHLLNFCNFKPEYLFVTSFSKGPEYVMPEMVIIPRSHHKQMVILGTPLGFVRPLSRNWISVPYLNSYVPMFQCSLPQMVSFRIWLHYFSTEDHDLSLKSENMIILFLGRCPFTGIWGHAPMKKFYNNGT